MTRTTIIIGVAACVGALAACKKDPARSTADGAAGALTSTPPAGGPASGPAGCKKVGPQVVALTTSDGVALRADLYTTGERGGPAAVLLHMIPPRFDRRSYPRALIDALVKAGITVLNLDRRGAGASKGVAKDAYQGPKGKLDAAAAYALLARHDCKPDLKRIAWIGASNGTTTALDFTVLAASDKNVESPAALVFLTGGPYTESQHKIADHRPLLDPLPILFVYSTAERAWSVGFDRRPPTRWMFSEHRGGAHGTKMFTAKPDSIARVVGFLEGALLGKKRTGR